MQSRVAVGLPKSSPYREEAATQVRTDGKLCLFIYLFISAPRGMSVFFLVTPSFMPKGAIKKAPCSLHNLKKPSTLLDELKKNYSCRCCIVFLFGFSCHDFLQLLFPFTSM